MLNIICNGLRIEDEQENINKSQGVDKIIDVIKKNRDKEKESFSIKVNRSNVEKCLIQFVESNKDNSWPSSTSIYLRCCHPFEGPPCSHRVIIIIIFLEYGIFCSPECSSI